MKTSFYFFLWIIIYPLLGLFHNQWVYQNSFIVALFAVWILSWIINKNMPKTLKYERITNMATVLEEVYSGNVVAFKKRLFRIMTVDFITAIYLGVGFIFVLFSMVRGNADDWIALLIFGFFAFGTLSHAMKLNKCYQKIQQNPSKEECESLVEKIFNFDYSSYSNIRNYTPEERMLPPEPKHFKVFQIVSLFIAILCCLFGLFYLFRSFMILTLNRSAEAMSGGIMYFLYGSLAAYFGVKDSINCIYYFRERR